LIATLLLRFYFIVRLFIEEDINLSLISYYYYYYNLLSFINNFNNLNYIKILTYISKSYITFIINNKGRSNLKEEDIPFNEILASDLKLIYSYTLYPLVYSPLYYYIIALKS